jgi:NhaP-type Na+/H+ or K+/H+ antiporter
LNTRFHRKSSASTALLSLRLKVKINSMPNAFRAEVYFIAAMMILILVVSGVSVYLFFKTYKKEMREKKARAERKAQAAKAESEIEN